MEVFDCRVSHNRYELQNNLIQNLVAKRVMNECNGVGPFAHKFTSVRYE